MSTSHKFDPVRQHQQAVTVRMGTSTIAVLAADPTSVAVPLVCTCVVMGVVTLPLGPLGIDSVLDLDSLLLGDAGAGAGAGAGPPVDDDDSGGFFYRRRCSVVRLTGLGR